LIFSRNKPLAMHFLWYFWKSLSFQYQELKHILYQHYAGTPYVKAKIEYLPSTQLKQKQIHTLSSVCGFNIKAKDTVLFDYGDSPSSMYVLIEGEIHLIHKSLTSHVENGQYFAEAALMDKSFNSTYQAKVIKNGSKIIKISRDILHNLIEKDESTAYEFLSIVCKMFAYKLQTLKKLA
ncbi:cyclic nucleotide-binding domain-containing protein, partial [bacterium]|nr:cyclic nucleotide-binding domain-containing protein [bacterium]